ncbi:hypothetical protein K0M31_005663 [Melipona bicolor]|uniref:Uncharacterized protein n=1 Tax=Melipona bicolor TaxID=60889 RepID=A0AA40FUE0_9HYME|nr:hypothetical protein K0M31_005663 [Melipona bicolor]
MEKLSYQRGEQFYISFDSLMSSENFALRFKQFRKKNILFYKYLTEGIMILIFLFAKEHKLVRRRNAQIEKERDEIRSTARHALCSTRHKLCLSNFHFEA